MSKWGLVLGLALPLVAQAQGGLAGLDRDMVGARSQVLVLGTVHLSQLPKSFNPAALRWRAHAAGGVQAGYHHD
jgi:hypothetical protein